MPLSEAATEQVYEIFNRITSEAEYLTRNRDPRQVSGEQRYMYLVSSIENQCCQLPLRCFLCEMNFKELCIRNCNFGNFRDAEFRIGEIFATFRAENLQISMCSSRQHCKSKSQRNIFTSSQLF